jgi:poly-gamma-glutamate capsule biosynthesis protein CapA/YwtB (metallophosphatase superfamily)
MMTWLRARHWLPCWVLLACVLILVWTCAPLWLSGPPPGESAGPEMHQDSSQVPGQVTGTELSHGQDGLSAVPRRFSVMAFGDILLARMPGERVAENGFRYPFTGIRDLVMSADIAFANLESPASWLGTPYPGKPENVTFRADPATLFGLAWAGFDLVSLANNHMNDYGPRALAETLDFLDLLGVARVGAGRDLEEASRVTVLERGGARFAFLAYAEPIWSVIGARPAAAGRTWARIEERFHGPLPGTSPPGKPDSARSSLAGVAIADIQTMTDDVTWVLSFVRPDYLFVSVHWGDELQRMPNRFQRAFGRAAIDAGATAVLGHHPHVLQAVEKYQGGLIIYSLGNLVFDMASELTYETAAFELHLEAGRLVSLEILPIRIDRGTYIPAPAGSADAKTILAGIRTWSGATGRAIRVDGGRGLLDFD